MSSTSLGSRVNLEKLDRLLEDVSYVNGYIPSCTDKNLFDSLNEAPPGDLFNACRWYRHIHSFTDSERANWGGESKSVVDLGLTTSGDDNKEDDELDLFGSDEETEADVKIREERIRQYETKKAAKPKAAAKSSIIFDVKPYDDETDLHDLTNKIKDIQLDGLVWGEAKQIPIAYGIKKIQIICVVEDDKISVDDLEEKLLSFDELVQSVDIVAFNKI